MTSILFFIFFTLTALLYRIIPSLSTIFLSVTGVAILSGCAFAMMFAPPRGLRGDPLASGNGGTTYNMHEALCIVPLVLNLALVIAAITVPEFSIWTIYTLTVIFVYVVPTVTYLICRTGFYRDVKKKVRSQGGHISGNMLDFFFTGKNNVHNITVETPVGTYTLGILGGIRPACYVIEDGAIKTQKVNFVNKKYAFDDYGGYEKNKVRLFSLGTQKRVRSLPEPVGRAYLMLQPNAFVVSNGLLVDTGEEIGGMRLLNMDTGMRIVR